MTTGLVRGKQKIRLPNLQIVIEMPSPLIQTTKGIQCHNECVRAALKDTLMEYWRTRWRDHYRQDARNKYEYRARAAGYKKVKMKEMKSAKDLIYRGKTELSTTHTIPQFSLAKGDVGGFKRKGTTTAGNFGVTGVLRMKFGFTGDSSKPPTRRAGWKPGGKQNPRVERMKTRRDGQKKIEPAEMAEELARWSDEAVGWARSRFINIYKDYLRAAIVAAPKWRKQYTAAYNQFHKATSW
jgi:hypothetical protein